MANVAPPKDFVFVGNHACLDFINTELVLNGTPADLLETFEDLLDWLVKSQTLSKRLSAASLTA